MKLLASLQQRLFRIPEDGPGPLRLGQRRVYILPSGAGLRYALMLLVMLLGAINYSLALGHALVFLLTGIGIVGMVHTFRNLHGLTIVPGRAEPVFAGETAHFSLTLDNDRPSPRFGLEFVTGGGTPVAAAVDGKNRTKINIPVVAEQRGWLALPRIRLTTGYPLGLFTAWSYLRLDMRCLVYPRPLATPLPPATAASHGGERGGAGDDDFAGFRERQPADSPRHVAWKQSARQAGEGPLLIKLFAGGANEELRLDWQMCSAADVETRLGILAGWVLAADREGLRYGLGLPGQHIPPDSGDTHRERCLRALALYETA